MWNLKVVLCWFHELREWCQWSDQWGASIKLCQWCEGVNQFKEGTMLTTRPILRDTKVHCIAKEYFHFPPPELFVFFTNYESCEPWVIITDLLKVSKSGVRRRNNDSEMKMIQDVHCCKIRMQYIMIAVLTDGISYLSLSRSLILHGWWFWIWNSQLVHPSPEVADNQSIITPPQQSHARLSPLWCRCHWFPWQTHFKIKSSGAVFTDQNLVCDM